jgi:anti-anti-sigma regulatory factor
MMLIPTPTRPTLPAFPDLAAAARLATRSLDGTATGRPRPPLVLDLSGVPAPTAGGLGQLVALHNRLRAMGGRLVLLNVRPLAYEAFKVTRLTDLLDVRRAGEAA